MLAVEHAGTRELLGHVGFSPLDEDVEVSYAIAEQARGRGYGTQALAAGCEWAARSFGLRRILAITAATNSASRRTLTRAGFAHVGDEVMRFQGSEQTVSRYAWSVGQDL